MTIKETTTEETLVRFEKTQVKEDRVLNEAYDYETPVPFTRGMRVELPGYSLILISGTASVDEHGRSIHIGDIKAQSWFQRVPGLRLVKH